MPRALRIEHSGVIYHVVHRGAHREPVVRVGLDRRRFPATLSETCDKTAWHLSVPMNTKLIPILCASVVLVQSLLAAPAPPVPDDPRLPRVLVIGDSISMNYHNAASNALQGVVNYHRIEGNAASTASRAYVFSNQFLNAGTFVLTNNAATATNFFSITS